MCDSHNQNSVQDERENPERKSLQNGEVASGAEKGEKKIKISQSEAGDGGDWTKRNQGDKNVEL